MTNDLERSMESYVWTLEPPSLTESVDEHTERMERDILNGFDDQEVEETALEGYCRLHIDLAEFREYYGHSANVIKLRVCDTAGDWHCSTASVLQDNILVTAAHVCYPKNKKSNKRLLAKNIEAIQGYHGKDSVKSNNVQYRHATHVILPCAFFRNDEKRDVACILLEKGFEGIEKCRFINTPKEEVNVVGVGFPRDNKTDVHGACVTSNPFECMIGSPGTAKYDPKKKKLICNFSTDKGNSGGPVYQQDTSNIIAIFNSGVTSGRHNIASIIGPDPSNEFENSLDAWVAFFQQRLSIEGLQDIPMKQQVVSVVYNLQYLNSNLTRIYTWRYGPNNSTGFLNHMKSLRKGFRNLTASESLD